MVIEEASEGREVIQKAGASQPQLIFMDIRLPDDYGLHLTKRIKAGNPDTKIIIMTGYDSMEYREAAIGCGANGYIAKDSLNKGQVETLIKSLVEYSFEHKGHHF